jgi:acetolactate synthase-1/2/3 large subunit
VVLVVGGTVAARSAVPVAAACRPAALPAPPPEALEAAGAAIGAAARPVVLAGRQCDAAVTPWLRAFAEAVPVPVVTTPPARGVLAEPHPLALGVLGAPAAAALLARADLVIALGVNDAELWPGALPKGTAVVRLARHTATAPPAAVAEATGDLALILEELAPRLRERERADWDVAELDRLKRAVSVPGPPGFTVRRVVVLVRAATPAGTIAAADVPAVAWWQTVAPRELLVGAGPGFAVLAAVATRLVHPGRTVVGFTTRGGLDRHASALAAASTPAAGAPLVAVAFAAPGATDGAGVAAAAGWRCLDAVDEAAFAFALERALSARWPTAIVARVGVNHERSS